MIEGVGLKRDEQVIVNNPKIVHTFPKAVCQFLFALPSLPACAK
jgi:hypothetical protein